MNSYHQGPHKHPEKTDTHTPHKDLGNPQLARLSLAALGVVFGDIATSPLYALRECFHGEYGIAVTQGNVFGILSLLFWALVIIVTLKYLTFILRADNHGEGGALALTALLKPKDTEENAQGKRGQWGLVLIGLFAACLLYGDGMITPAISVLSAVEGVRIITPFFKPYVVPLTIIILASLFLLQHRGTARVAVFLDRLFLYGSAFSPFLDLSRLFGIRKYFLLFLPGMPSIFSCITSCMVLLSSALYSLWLLGRRLCMPTSATSENARFGWPGSAWCFLPLS